MYSNITKQEKEMAEELQKRREEEKINPLLRYSTTQLKAELRRRKAK